MAVTDEPFVSIITVNWNGVSETCAFLESTKKLNYTNYEIIVVDNGSQTDPTEEIEAGNFPNTKVVRTKANLGFAGGNNFGMRHIAAHYDFCFYINNDVEVTPDLISTCVAPFLKDNKIGMVSPKIKFYYNPSVIQYAGFNKMNMLTGQKTAVGSHQEDSMQYTIGNYTDSAHGCAMLVSRKAIEDVGLMSEIFFLYYEEIDWCARIAKAGYKIFYQGNTVVYHKESMSVGKSSTLKVHYMNRNRILYMRRHATAIQLIAFVTFFSLFTVPKSIISFIIQKEPKHLKAFLKGIAWNFTNAAHIDHETKNAL